MISLELNLIHHESPEITLDEALVGRLVSHTLAAEGADGEWAVSVVLVNDGEMQRMHAEFMSIDEPTDIMTFPYDEETHGEIGGDLVISVDRAAEQGADAGSTQGDELLFLIVHGVLHLLGWDDTADDDRTRMLARQQEIIQSLQP